MYRDPRAPETLNPEQNHMPRLDCPSVSAETLNNDLYSLQTLPGLSECECQKNQNPHRSEGAVLGALDAPPTARFVVGRLREDYCEPQDDLGSRIITYTSLGGPLL